MRTFVVETGNPYSERTAYCADAEAAYLRGVRLSGVTETAQGFGTHDHLCWVYDEPSELYAPVMDFLADGLAQGQRVCYVASGDTVQWSEYLRDLDKPNGARRKGAAQVLRLREVYTDEVVEPARQMQTYAAATEDALAAGFTGLRVAVDVTPLVRTSEQLDAFARWELLADQNMIYRPFSALCGYNRAELGQEVITQLACLHPTVNGAPPQFQLHASTDSAAASLSGELDHASYELFKLALRRADLRPTGGELVIDATKLTFVDHWSLLALATHAQEYQATAVLRTGRRAPARIIEILDLQSIRVEVPV
jgi:anti-anti-sigma regulatory factor